MLSIRERIPTTLIQRHVQYAGDSEEEKTFYTKNDDTEEQIWQLKKDARENPMNELPDISFI